jgi:DNA-binding winged helix-turn-helix (wHTH) protein
MGWKLEKTPRGYIMYSTIVDEYISPLLKNKRSVKTWINKNVTRNKKKAFIYTPSDKLVGTVDRDQLNFFLGRGDKEIPRKEFVDFVWKNQLADAKKLKKVI